MNVKLENCPAPEKLADFLLGRLPIGENESCEVHLASCDPCVDTIRGLNVDSDTLNELTRQAWTAAAEQEAASDSESQIVDGIIQRMQSLTRVSQAKEFGGRSQVDEDRAAEVQRLLGPALQPNEIGALGDYRIVSMLGAGSTGVVYKAIDSQLDRIVALKVLRPSLGQAARKRFVAEARAAAAVTHPNVVPIYRAGSHGDLAFMAMQWIPGQTLDQLLADQETLSVEQVKKMGIQIANGLSAAHEQGLIHRDIKPANIWVADESQEATILDFGLVRITDENPQLTCTGMIAGTPCFMSPEQSRGQKLDCRSDLFSLGCLLYQALAGRLPFQSGNALATLQSIQREQPTPLADVDPTIPRDISDLVMMLLEKSPSRRPPTANDVAFAISTPRIDWPFPVFSGLPVKQLPQRRSRIGLGWKAVTAAIVVLVLGSLGFFLQPQVTRIITNRGEIVIESEVDDVQIEVLRNGEMVRLIDLATEQTIEIKAGEYEFRPTGEENGIEIKNGILTLTRGEKEIVKITKRAVSDAGNDGGTRSAYSNEPVDDTPKVTHGTLLDVDSEIRTIELAPGAVKRLRFPQAIPEVAITGTGIFDVRPVSANEVVLTALKAGSTTVNFMREDGTIQRITISVKVGVHQLASGDVLGVFIDGVLGEIDQNPPVNFPEPESGLPPSLGFPIPVRENGTISLPLVAPLDVEGKTLRDVESEIKKAFMEGDNPILKKNARVLVSLMRSRDYVPPQQSPSTPRGVHDELRLQLYQLESDRALAASKYGANHAKMRDLDRRIELTQKQLAESLTPVVVQPNPTQQNVREQSARLIQSDYFKLRASAERQVVDGRAQDALVQLKQFRKSLGSADINDDLREVLEGGVNRDIESIEKTLGSDRNSRHDSAGEGGSMDSEKRIVRSAFAGGGRNRAASDAALNSPNAPVFDGRTYREWFEVAKRERDLSILNPAIKALAVLADENQQSEMIATIMEVARRGTGLAEDSEIKEFRRFMRSFFSELKPDDAKELFIHEWVDGSDISKSLVSSELMRLTGAFHGLKKEECDAAVAEIVDVLIENSSDDPGYAGWQEITMLAVLRKQSSVPFEKNEKLIAFLSRIYREHLKHPLHSNSQLIFIELMPEHEDHVEKIAKDLFGNVDIPGAQNWRMTIGFQAFVKLPLLRRQQVVSKLVAWFEKNEEAKSSFAEKLSNLVNSNFEEIQPSLEKIEEIAESNKLTDWAQELQATIDVARRKNK